MGGGPGGPLRQPGGGRFRACTHLGGARPIGARRRGLRGVHAHDGRDGALPVVPGLRQHLSLIHI
eukprot:6459918-Pyramimonas_sp.AAC.1